MEGRTTAITKLMLDKSVNNLLGIIWKVQMWHGLQDIEKERRSELLYVWPLCVSCMFALALCS